MSEQIKVQITNEQLKNATKLESSHKKSCFRCTVKAAELRIPTDDPDSDILLCYSCMNDAIKYVSGQITQKAWTNYVFQIMNSNIQERMRDDMTRPGWVRKIRPPYK